MVLGIAIIGRRSQIVEKKRSDLYKHETSTPSNLPQVQQSLTWILHLHLQPCCCLTCTPGAAKRISEMSRWGLKTWFAEIYVRQMQHQQWVLQKMAPKDESDDISAVPQ